MLTVVCESKLFGKKPVYIWVLKPSVFRESIPASRCSCRDEKMPFLVPVWVWNLVTGMTKHGRSSCLEKQTPGKIFWEFQDESSWAVLGKFSPSCSSGGCLWSHRIPRNDWGWRRPPGPLSSTCHRAQECQVFLGHLQGCEFQTCLCCSNP